MANMKIPEKDAVFLIRALGLLVSQAAVYGPSHNVTQSAARSVFAELEQAAKSFGSIEIALRNQQIVLNGADDGISAIVGKNLADRMAMHKISGLVFLVPPDLREFLRFITLFGTQPMAFAAEGGFAGAMKKELMQSVAVVTVAYQRVTDKKPPEEPKVPAPVRIPAPASMGVLDLSAAWGADSASETEPPSEQTDAEETARQKRSSDMAAVLREAAALLESGQGYSAQKLHPSVTDAFRRIRGFLSDMAGESERQITTLASQVSDDRQTIASIESAARRRGIGL